MIEQTNNQPTEQKTVVHGKGRGFLSMTPEKRHAIAAKGGRRAHELGTAHKFTMEEAQAAGRKGGYATHKGHKLTPEQLEERRRLIISGEI